MVYIAVVSSAIVFASLSLASVCVGRGESGEVVVCMGRGASGDEGDVAGGGEEGKEGTMKSEDANPSPVGNWKLVLTMAVRSFKSNVRSSSSSLVSAVWKSI